MDITHKQAVRRIGNWLRNANHCSVVMVELHTANTETPDAIGWHGHGGSILVEVKVSRADFLADKNKVFRRCADYGMGDLRYYAAPKGLLVAADLPDGWGLLEIDERCVREKVHPQPGRGNKSNEVKMLMSSIRRLELSTAVFVRQPADENSNAALASALRESMAVLDECNVAVPDMMERWEDVLREHEVYKAEKFIQ